MTQPMSLHEVVLEGLERSSRFDFGKCKSRVAKTKVRGIHIRSIDDDICHHTLVITADLDIVDSLYEVELLAFGHGIRLVISFAR